MANYQNILRQAHQAIADVADNADSWRAFLRSAAYTTHYAFPNQALIYSQRPGATMLADIDTWNRAAGRWVNRGARGVASLGTGNMAGNVRYLFDIKDTHPAGKAAKPLGWQITDANRYPTLQALQEKHNAESLPEIFGLQAALFVAQHGKQLDADLQNAVIGSTLEWAKPQEQTAIFANLITQSAVYMAAVRCGLGDSAVPQDAFADIDRFDTESAVLALGNAVNRAGRQMFAEIGAVVKSIDSVAKTQPKQYDENVSKTNQQEVQDHGYDESERVSGAQDGNEGNAQTAGRENRSAAGEVPAREPLPAVRQDAAGRDAVQRPETDRAALLGAGGADHHEAAGQQPGTGQEQRPIGLDGAHEQSASAGSGIGDTHRDEPVNTEPTTAESELSPSAVSVSDEIELPESVGRGNLAEETAAAIGLPAPEQQQETIRQLQHRASWQPPIKDDGTHIDEQDIVDVLVMGSGFCEGRFRIQEFFSATVLPTVKEQADWLKKEYGIGGRTWDFRDGERGFLDYDAKGLRIKRYASDNAPDHFRLLPWNEVARRLHLLVHNDKYLDENNKQGYEKWEAEQKAKRDARQAEIDYAEKTIADFCEREGLGAPDYSDLTHIDLAYSTTGDGEHEIQVYANFLRNEIVYNERNDVVMATSIAKVDGAASSQSFEVVRSKDANADFTEQQTLKFYNDREKAKVGIYKTDLESGKYLAGAVFNLYTADDIYDADGSLVFAAGELVATSPETNADGTTYFDCDIPIRGEQYGSSTHKDAATNSGKYIIEEIRAPLGYYVNEEPMEVTFTYDGQTVRILESTCTDKPTEMWVSKRDLTNDEELPGATLTIQDMDGNIVESWVSTDTPHRVTGLHLGDAYTLTETRPADGYALADEITFRLLQKVDEDGSNLQEAEAYYLTKKSLLFWTWDDWKLLDDATVIMRDDTIKAEFSKKDLTTMEELPGAELTITDKDGKEIDRWVSSDKPHYIEKLPAGDYTLTEVKAPDGYAFAESVPFTALPTGEVQQFEMLDDVIKVEISKKDLTTMEELPGAELTLTDKGGTVVEHWTSTDKPHYIEKLPAGDYTLTEVKAPDGYAFAESVPFTVLPTGEVQRFEMLDDVIKVEISKVDITTNKELPGAELIITNKDGKVVEHWTSTDKPHYIEKLPAGEYTLTEITAPNGYEIAEDIPFTVLPTGEVQRVVMKDAPIPEQPVQPTPPTTPTPTPLIPQTGDTFPLGLLLALAGLSLAGLAALIFKCVHCKAVAQKDDDETE